MQFKPLWPGLARPQKGGRAHALSPRGPGMGAHHENLGFWLLRLTESATSWLQAAVQGPGATPPWVGPGGPPSPPPCPIPDQRPAGADPT